MNKKQQGIALIETLLIILILAIIGFGGYYVWHTQKDNNKVTSDTLKASNSQTAATNKNTPSSSQNYLTIKEWGVRVPYSGSDTYAYTYDTATPNLVEVRSTELATKYGCTQIGAGLLSRSQPTDETYYGSGESIESYANQNPGTYFKVGDYYYAWAHDQAACSNNVTAEAQNQASTALESYVKNIQAIPQ